MNPMDILKAACRKQETQTIFECVIQLATVTTTEERMARAALIAVYEERTSLEQADALMDLIGL